MKLRRVQVQNFRSIVDSATVDVEDRVTVLIGKNEQGKTNFLKGIVSFNSKASYGPNDLPNHLLAVLEEKNQAEIPVITLWLAPESLERAALKGLIPDIDEVTEFKARRWFNGHYDYWTIKGTAEANLQFAAANVDQLVDDVNKVAETLKTKLASHASRLPAFAPALPQAQSHIDEFVGAKYTDDTQIDNIVKTFSTALRALPSQDAAIQEEVAQAVKDIQLKLAEVQQELQKNPARAFQAMLPQFPLCQR